MVDTPKGHSCSQRWRIPRKATDYPSCRSRLQTLIVFQGTLSSWWTKIVIGILLFLFCLLQRLFETGKGLKIQGTTGEQKA